MTETKHIERHHDITVGQTLDSGLLHRGLSKTNPKAALKMAYIDRVLGQDTLTEEKAEEIMKAVDKLVDFVFDKVDTSALDDELNEGRRIFNEPVKASYPGKGVCGTSNCSEDSGIASSYPSRRSRPKRV